ncbi:MAG: DNA polymerase IV [Planctomycetota bacterium]|jgi:DNA polymerase-4
MAAVRTILHVDMDAFYASIEQRDDPALRDRPVIVGGPRDARGVVSAASYEARRFGVRSAMPLRTAARLCPDGVFVPVRMSHYLAVSRQVFGIFEAYSPLVEPLSVDEAFLDLTGCERLFGGPVAAADALRAEIAAQCRLTASVGVAPNKFVAKIASDLEKPDGLVVVGDVRAFLAPLPVERMWGIGRRGAEALHSVGVRTFGDLAQVPVARLRPLFGAAAYRLRDLAAGKDARPVVTERAPKSLGHETTFPEDVREKRVLRATLVSLTDRVAARLRRHGLKARCVTLKVRYAPFRTITRRISLEAATCATGPLLDTVLDLLARRTPHPSPPVRLLGVSTSGFSAQTLLFSGPDARQGAVDRAVDAVRERFGAAALKRASVIEGGAR